MRIKSRMRRSCDLLAILGATLLFMPLEGRAEEADRFAVNLRVSSGSASNLAQAPDQHWMSESRKRYEAAAERARAALEAETAAREANEAPPRVPRARNSGPKDAVCIAGC
jgi:hypothetical protein